MPDRPLIAHSLAEAYLYLMVTPCRSCGRGPLKGSDAVRTSGVTAGPMRADIQTRCGGCDGTSMETFDFPFGLGQGEGEPAAVNPTEEPSHIVDVAQWLVLFRTITEAASRETDKIQARILGLEAAQCLEEALRFYDDPDNDLPPEESFFHESSRRRRSDHPEQFSRQRLLDLRAKLPTVSAMRSVLAGAKKRSWWRLKWRGNGQ